MTDIVTSNTDYHIENAKLYKQFFRESLNGYIHRTRISYNSKKLYEQLVWLHTHFYKMCGSGDKLKYMVRRRHLGKNDIKTSKDQIYNAMRSKFGESLEELIQGVELLMLIPSCVSQTYDPSTRDIYVKDATTHVVFSNTYVPPNLEANEICEDMPERFQEYLDRLIPPDQMSWYKSNPEEKFSQQEYVLKWLSQRIQNPIADPTVALVLTGEQGTGKSFLFDTIMKPLVGEHNYLTTNMENVKAQFSLNIFTTTLLHVEEVNDNRGKALDKLKELTKKEHSVDAKFRDREQITKNFGYVVTSNKPHPIKVELSDRRHFFTCFSKVSDDTPAFMKKFAHWIYNENGLQDILNYLYCLDITDFDIRDCPLTDTKLSLMEQESFTEQGMSKAELWLSENRELLFKPSDIGDYFKISIAQAQQVLRNQGFQAFEQRRWVTGGNPFVAWKHVSYKPKHDSHTLWDSKGNDIHFGKDKDSFDDGITVMGDNPALSSPTQNPNLWS